ncbi:DUF4232 domain-containing protein [Streptomyces netropsis]|uniref:DUF4232 domain-containing protein n=1 Tax=Streptomyces netropsis TaxID=55404 RepID=A0A7W7PFD2_STRNE|nr:DUF4232 domain-containing protein [Streptomyces netropsis]MBB4887597.1 hypothetical protein [Streptomyces netropsis]GGR34662.1 hypothetical protein GCM10010219_44580 [Streptomyces netropsis]
MRASVRRPRLLAAVSVAIAALALTACENGGGVREEGAASQPAQPSEPSQPTAPGSPAPKPDGTAGPKAPGEKGTSGTSGTSTGKGGGRASAPAADADPNAPANRVPCTADNTEVVATPVSRPLNHMLLTITNTGSKMCDLKGYPIVKFEGAQSVPPVIEASKPQAVTSLAPGKKGYAAVILSAGDGSGGEGRTAQSLEIGFQGSDKMAEAALQAKGVHVDDSLRVTYWLATAADALT